MTSGDKNPYVDHAAQTITMINSSHPMLNLFHVAGLESTLEPTYKTNAGSKQTNSTNISFPNVGSDLHNDFTVVHLLRTCSRGPGTSKSR